MTAAPTVPRSVSAREGYAKWAEGYSEDANPVVALQERSLRAVLPEARGKTVVDLGCGTGRTMSLWRERQPARLIGVDLSPQMLEMAAGTADSLIAADCCALPLAGGIADVVSCCLTLGYLADLGSFAAEVARIVTPGGIVLISELHPESVVRFGWRRGFSLRGESVSIHACAYPIHDVAAAFENHGFEVNLLLQLPFGTAELDIFEAAGRREQFERFRGYPAIYALQLRRGEPTNLREHSFCFANPRLVLNATESTAANVCVSERRVDSIGLSSAREALAIDLSGYMLFPGLINAHDHLEFALFPRLGRGLYQNSRQWAEDIYRPDESPIREHLRVPKPVRLWWGGLRNLLCGVTTVCHHNPYEAEVFDDGFPVRVVRDIAWAHSLGFDAGLVRRFRETGSDIPFVIHAAEGIDQTSSEEVRTLSKLGVLHSRTVVVHGTGLDDDGLSFLNDSGAALVWCPSSNTFLFDKTLTSIQVDRLESKALGSDSPLTASGDLLDELRFARHLGASPEMLFQLVTAQANRVLRLKREEGQIRPGAVADLIAVRDYGLSPAEILSSLSYRDVELVVLDGKVQLVSENLKSSLPKEIAGALELLIVGGIRRWVRAPIRQMLELSREALGPEITMCGRSLTQ